MSDSGGTPMLTALKINTPWLSDLAAFVGEVARPFAIISTSGAASISVVHLTTKVDAPNAALYIGAVFAGVGALYMGKAWEKVTQIRKSGSPQ